MSKYKSYCDYCKNLPKDNPHRIYHDQFYGFPVENDNELFGRFILEINQAGLSWDIILKKKENFKKAYEDFNIARVASYGERDIERLLNDAGIIRNRLKINAAIHNANVLLQIQKDFGSFKKWLDYHKNLSKAEWVKLFKKTFKFTGGEIVGEYLMSTGYLIGAHVEECEVYRKLTKLNRT